MALTALESKIDQTNHKTATFRTLSRQLYPKTIYEVLEWADELWSHGGIYSQAISKAVRYFMTELDVSGDEEITYSTKANYKQVLENKFDILSDLAVVGDDFIAFGNSFTSVYVPFIRQLKCPICGATAPLREIFEDYVEWDNGEFRGKCWSDDCGEDIVYVVADVRKSEDNLKPVIIRWPPQYMSIKYNPITGSKEFRIDFSKYEDLKKGITDRDTLFFAETPMEIINAVHKGEIFEFDEEEIFHISNQTTAYAVPTLNGWGLPKFMSEFETVVLIYMLDKFNESIVADYLVPFRVVSPPSTGNAANIGSMDPMLNINMSDFVGYAKKMFDRHRKNPTGWNMFPTPLQYQVLGGEAKDLAPVELMSHFEARLLNGMGIPQEFYTGSINNSAGPIIGFKMFERTWQHFVKELDNWLSWFIQKIGELYNWEKVTAKLIPVTLYEDPELRGIKLELAAASVISQTTALRSIGIDRAYERNLIEEEQKEDMKAMEKMDLNENARQTNMQAAMTPGPGEELLMQQEQEMAAQQGGMPPAQDPMAMSAGPAVPDMTNASLDELIAQADTIANDLMFMDPYARRQQLLDLANNNQALHAQVSAMLEKKENAARQQGLNMTRRGEIPPPQQQQ